MCHCGQRGFDQGRIKVECIPPPSIFISVPYQQFFSNCFERILKVLNILGTHWPPSEQASFKLQPIETFEEGKVFLHV